jgi:hypothetical protein
MSNIWKNIAVLVVFVVATYFGIKFGTQVVEKFF